MEQLVIFNTMMSLKEIALVQVSGYIWNREIPKMPKRSYFYGDLEFWDISTLKVEKTKVPLLRLTESVKVELLIFIKLMGRTICDWCNEVRRQFTVREICFHTICWTQQGLINRQETVEHFLEDQQKTLDVTEQFELARIFCLGDRLWTLFKKLNNSQIESLEGVFNYYQDEWSILWRRATLLEEDISLIERLCPLDSYCEAFRHATLNSYNVVGMNYFFRKLTPAEAETHLVQTTVDVAEKSCYDSQRHIVCFVFSHMNRTQQLETLERNPSAILKCFLLWPWQNYFMKVANCTWDFLTEHHFYAIILFIQFDLNSKTSDCQKIFKEFWLQSAPAHKEYIINSDEKICYLLTSMVNREDMQNVNVILDCTTADRRRSIISSPSGGVMCHTLLYEGKSDELVILLNKCGLSRRNAPRRT